MTEEDKLYTITCNERQVDLISQACEFVSKIGLLKFETISEIISPKNKENAEKFQDELFRIKKWFGVPRDFSYDLNDFENVGNHIRIFDSISKDIVKDFKGSFSCNKEQLKLISLACDFTSRIQILQFSEVARIVQPKYENDRDFKLLHAFQDELLDLKQWFGFSRNASYGIYSHEVQDSARTLYDMHQIIRNKLAYEANPEVNYGNRWEKGKITIDFDEPHQSDKENELIKIS